MIHLKANFRDFNPLAPKIDWFLNSPHGITLESNVKVVRIKEMITSLGSPDCQANCPCKGNVRRSVRRR